MTDSVVPEPYYAAQELHSAAMGACYAALGAYMAHMLHMLHMAGVPGLREHGQVGGTRCFSALQSSMPESRR